jgi:PKD repeat protein
VSGTLATLAAGGDQQEVQARGDGQGHYLLVWQDDRNGNWDVYGAVFQPLAAGLTLTPTAGNAPLPVTFTDTSTPTGAADR